jgi:DNA modification methylase
MPVKKPAKKPAFKPEKQLNLLDKPARLPDKRLPMLHAWEEATVKSIKPYDQNPRINQPVELVADSLQEFGWASPIVVDENFVIICGHTRFKAAQTLGLTHVPYIRADGWTEAQVKAFRVMDNQAASVAEWDPAFLNLELRDLDELGYTSNSLGFTDDELAKITGDAIKTLEPEAATGDADDSPDADEENPPITVIHDVYQIGPHRLRCGDSTSLDDVTDLMAGQEADMVFTDPPYNVAYEGKKVKRKAIINDNINNFGEFLNDVFANLYISVKPGSALYVSYSNREADSFRDAVRDAVRDAGFTLKQTIAWIKNHFVLGRLDYHCQYEPIIYGWKPDGDGQAHRWYGDRNKSDVWQFDKPQKSVEHPTMKPVALVEYAITNSSQSGELVLDLFGGSGTTMVAAQQTGRIAYLMELDPKYCDVILKRMLNLWPTLPVTRNGEAFSLPDVA